MKKVTHVAAAVFTAVAGFAVSPAGQAVVAQYPKLTILVSLITAVGALYHSPKKEKV